MPDCVLGNFFIYSIINAFTQGQENVMAINIVTDYGC